MKKINIYIWCSKGQLRQIIDYFDDIGCNIDLLTWHKTNPIPTCNNTYLSDTEYCVFAREEGVKLEGTVETKKKYYVTPCNVADKELGRRYIGMELNPKYYEIACNRINGIEASGQMTLMFDDKGNILDSGGD